MDQSSGAGPSRRPWSNERNAGSTSTHSHESSRSSSFSNKRLKESSGQAITGARKNPDETFEQQPNRAYLYGYSPPTARTTAIGSFHTTNVPGTSRGAGFKSSQISTIHGTPRVDTRNARPRVSQGNPIYLSQSHGQIRHPEPSSQRRVSTMTPHAHRPQPQSSSNSQQRPPLNPTLTYGFASKSHVKSNNALSLAQDAPEDRRTGRGSARANSNRTNQYRQEDVVTVDDVPSLRGYFGPNLSFRDVEPEDPDSDVEMVQQTPPVRGARKSVGVWDGDEAEPPASDSSEDEQEEGEEEEEESSAEPEIIEVKEIQPPSFPNLPTRTKIDPNPTPALSTALKRSVLRLPASRLPFLRKNLRVGFLRKCEKVTLTGQIDEENKGVRKTTYLYRDPDDMRRGLGLLRSYSVEGSVGLWPCPLCVLHRPFTNRYMLQKHLEWDHEDVRVRWFPEGGRPNWTIEVFLPDPAPTLPAQSAATNQPASILGDSAPDAVVPERDVTTPPSVQSERDEGREVPTRSTTVVAFSSRTDSVSRRTPFTREHTDSTAFAPTSTDVASSTVVSGTKAIQNSRSPSPNLLLLKSTTLAAPIDGDNEYNPLGPTADLRNLFPFSSDGITMNYSCRIGGPKLYDLLSTLSMEPFGVLAWEVLDREEEIFEVDDLKDEYKVMHALWARWIFLNRPMFIKNYAEGVRLFIDEYWKMIQLAAGWEALRYWLLLLLPLKYLTGHDVADLIKYYQEKVRASEENAWV